jgi:hypothetical protein
MAAAHYGLLLSVAIFVMTQLMPQPAGSVILFGFFAVQLSWGAVTCWRRTGLPFATAALVNAAVMSLCLVVLEASGHPFRALAPASWVLYVGGVITTALLIWIESRVNQPKWKEWSRLMEHKNVWDIVTGRHFPELRDRGTSAP